MTENVLCLVEGTAHVQQVQPAPWRGMCGVTCRARPPRRAAAVISSPTAPGPHRRAGRLAEQGDQHEIASGCPRNARPFELIGVERLHGQEIQRHGALPPRFAHAPFGLCSRRITCR